MSEGCQTLIIIRQRKNKMEIPRTHEGKFFK